MDAGDANVAPDAPVDGPASDGGAKRCDPTGPFGAPVLIAEVNSSFDETGARLSWDELTIYFSSTRFLADPDAGQGTQLLYAHRPSLDVPFGAPEVLANVNSPYNESHPMVSADGLTLFFASDRREDPDAALPLNIFTATRGAPGSPTVSPFTNPTKLVALASDSVRGTPFLSADGTELWYSAAHDGDPALHIHRSVGPTFNGGALVDELDLPGSSQRFPLLSADGLTLYFASDRAGGVGLGDIWYAKRASTTAAFQEPVSASTLNALLNSPALDDPTWISPDDCRLYFASDRDQPATQRNIYVATRTK